LSNAPSNPPPSPSPPRPPHTTPHSSHNQPAPSRPTAAGTPSSCSRTGTPLATPVVGGGSFGFSVSTDEKASTIAVGQPDATGSQGIVYAYNQVKLCAYQSYELPRPPAPTAAQLAGGEAPAGLLGMMTALSRDGRWLAVAGTLEGDGAMAQVFVYRRQSNDSTGGFVLYQKLALQPAATPGAAVYAGSLSVSRDGRLVLVSWSVYGAGRGPGSGDAYGPPSGDAQGSAQLYRRPTATGRYTRAQGDLALLAPALARTQFFGANSYLVADGGIAAISTRLIDATKATTGSPAIVLYQRTPTGAFVYVSTLKVPSSDGAFALTESGGHLAVARGADVHVYAREGVVATGKFVFNKRCTLLGDEMNLEASEWFDQKGACPLTSSLSN